MIRFGIVGAGNIANKFANDFKVVKNAKLVAVASRNIDRANKFKERYDIELSYGNYEEMAKDKTIDAVYIATPHNFHKEHSILFMKNGKHVICEKPVALNENEYDEMVAVAKENNVLMMEAMWTRFLPVHRELLQLVKTKQYGNIKKMDLPFCIDLMPNTTDEKRILNINLAGGSLLDVGIYPVSYFMFINNAPIKSISACAEFYKTGVDLYCEVFITLDNKEQTEVALRSAVDREELNSAVFTFDDTIIEIPNFHRGNEMIINGVKKDYPLLSTGFEFQIQSFVDTLLKGKLENDIMTHQASKEVMNLMDSIRELIGLKYPQE
jgi:predicted dehydrogenase